MNTSDARFAHIQPSLRLCLDGRWLAVSEDGANLHIGVEGTSEEEAEELFHEAIAAWEHLWTDADRTTY